MQNNVIHGVRADYSSSGVKICEWNFVHGQVHGKVTDYYDKKGSIKLLSDYQHDKLHGKVEKFTIKGIKEYKESYDKGIKHGVFKTYDSKGKVDSEQRYHYGQFVEQQ